MSRIIPADQRCTAPRGAKMLIVGPTGVGKTSLLKTLDPTTTLFIDVEAGDLAVQDVAVDTLRPRTWPQCRDLAVYLAGANPAVPANAVYSAAHYDAVATEFDDTARLDRYQTYFFDSHPRRPPVLRVGEPAVRSILRALRQARSSWRLWASCP
jgi:energy-coupling factor transporter ATP-binding protein EcfA2